MPNLNGKKRYIVGSGITASVLITILLNFNTGITANSTELKAHKEAIEKVEQTPIEIEGLEGKVTSLEKTVDRNYTEQRTWNDKMDGQMKELKTGIFDQFDELKDLIRNGGQ